MLGPGIILKPVEFSGFGSVLVLNVHGALLGMRLLCAPLGDSE